MKQDSFKNFISRLAAKLAGKGSRTKHLARKSKDKVEDLETRTLLTSILAVDNANNLLQFDSSNPTTGVGPLVPITGLGVGEVIEGIDVRAANGEVYGLGITDNGATRTGQIYTIDPSSGAALAVGTSFANNLADTDAWGFDADPVNDILRVVNDAEQNLEVSPVTGALISTDTNLAGNPNISG
ncbi:MAG: hypothetical protein JWM11_763, partial [Planctomycetaceae bacterium]|nr:hypothetical protein [Planctomycetaceae bacterium]